MTDAIGAAENRPPETFTPMGDEAVEWPIPYQLLQAGVAVLTVTQLHLAVGLSPLGPVEPHPTLSGLFESIRLFSLLDPLRGSTYLGFSYALLRLGAAWDRRHGGLWGSGRTRTPLWKIMAGNMALYGATLLIDCTLTSVIDCGGAVWSGVPLATQVEVLVRKWHAYHRPEFLLVRMSHAFTYLPVLMCLSRRTGLSFARWRVFMLFIPDAIADWAHYADSPLVAAQRLGFESADLCEGIDRHFVRTAVSFPMNWLFLTTGLGDPSTSVGGR